MIAKSALVPEVGRSYSLTCTFQLSYDLYSIPSLKWTRDNGGVVSNDSLSAITIGMQQKNSITMTFDPIRPDHRGTYVCSVSLIDERIQIDMSASMSSTIAIIGKNNYF